ncbi:L-threonylcarbamoyladenylate synthase [Actinomycetospora termitidis]|uniref:L-threonylcarbamoyladenylate synthase n=1 Tax=Actinomycetospora termitidis TaxID=3053470 RepID=A0ABT7M8T1_9PSEU|nr:L-threonylcarbamoyladenylate synthase [Actinomycetospora sp. Odt1-22]MDL5157089.1 L-threonylcarbamoyladenylate synthase [Actinomycetospora sp. Odt1-22]
MTLTLAVETSSRTYGVALLDDDTVLAQATADRSDPGFVDVGVLAGSVIADAGRTVADLDRLAVDVGPGNLASVRAGIAYVNAVAFARAIPVVGLDALTLLTDGPTLALRLAGGSAVYAALTRADGSVATRHGDLAVVVKDLFPTADGATNGPFVTEEGDERPVRTVPVGPVRVAGARRPQALALLAELGVDATDAEIDAPSVDDLVRALRRGEHDAPVVSAAPLTEASVRFRGDAWAAAREALLAGGVALLPTDTVYGLAVHPARRDAIDALFALKDRPRTRELPIMVATPDELPSLGVQVPDTARRLLGAFSPGPITVALGIDDTAPPWLAGRDEVGVRVPADPDLRALLSDVGALLVTSANAHGEVTHQAPEPILAQLAGRPDAVVDGGTRSGVPSTVVNCHLDTPRIEREGAIPAAEIERVVHGG